MPHLRRSKDVRELSYDTTEVVSSQNNFHRIFRNLLGRLARFIDFRS